jgi:hypothetical protein
LRMNCHGQDQAMQALARKFKADLRIDHAETVGDITRGQRRLIQFLWRRWTTPANLARPRSTVAGGCDCTPDGRCHSSSSSSAFYRTQGTAHERADRVAVRAVDRTAASSLSRKCSRHPPKARACWALRIASGCRSVQHNSVLRDGLGRN